MCRDHFKYPDIHVNLFSILPASSILYFHHILGVGFLGQSSHFWVPKLPRLQNRNLCAYITLEELAFLVLSVSSFFLSKFYTFIILSLSNTKFFILLLLGFWASGWETFFLLGFPWGCVLINWDFPPSFGCLCLIFVNFWGVVELGFCCPWRTKLYLSVRNCFSRSCSSCYLLFSLGLFSKLYRWVCVGLGIGVS